MRRRNLVCVCGILSSQMLLTKAQLFADVFTGTQGVDQTDNESIAVPPYSIFAGAVGGSGGVPLVVLNGVANTYFCGNGGVGTARAQATGDTSGASAQASATGGDGGSLGNVNDNNVIYGGNGGLGISQSVASASSGTVMSIATQIGGSGGSAAFQENDNAQGYGGNGADSNMINNASGSNLGGTLTLIQNSTAGSGGQIEGCWGGGSPGSAGNSTASLDFSTLNTETSVTASNFSTAGYGGGSFFVSGVPVSARPGGAASATTALQASGQTTLNLTGSSVGGMGGSANEGGSPAIGGTANTVVNGQTTGTGIVTGMGNAIGGRGGSLVFSGFIYPSVGAGGSGALGGGADCQVSSTSNTAPSSATAMATGGAGGTGETNSFVGGNGNTGGATATAASIYGAATATAYATGGAGGQGNDGANGGLGGDGIANAIAISQYGNVTASATASGGTGGGATPDPLGLNPLGIAGSAGGAEATIQLYSGTFYYIQSLGAGNGATATLSASLTPAGILTGPGTTPSNIINAGRLSVGGGLLGIPGSLTNLPGSQLGEAFSPSDHLSVGGTFVNSGLATLANLTANAVSIEGSGSIIIAGSDHATSQYSDINTLSINAGASLFIASDTVLIIHNANLADLRASVTAGFNEKDFTWKGSMAAGIQLYQPPAGTGLAIVTFSEASRLDENLNIGQFGVWNGGDTALVAAQFGDTDVNGTVDYNDFLTIEANFGSTSADWSMGDFNYDGQVGVDDYNEFLINYEADNDGAMPDADIFGGADESAIRSGHFMSLETFAADHNDLQSFD